MGLWLLYVRTGLEYRSSNCTCSNAGHLESCHPGQEGKGVSCSSLAYSGAVVSVSDCSPLSCSVSQCSMLSRSEKQTPFHLVPTEKSGVERGERETGVEEKKGEAEEEKKGGGRTAHPANTTHPRKLDNNSDSEGDVDERKRRPRHVPGAKGTVPPPQSALAKKFAASSVSLGAVSQQPECKSGPARPRAAASAAPGRPVPLGESKHPRLLVTLMEICKVDTPIIKRVPNAQRSNFASFWGLRFQSMRLLGLSSSCFRSASCGRLLAGASAWPRKPTWQSSFARG